MVQGASRWSRIAFVVGTVLLGATRAAGEVVPSPAADANPKPASIQAVGEDVFLLEASGSFRWVTRWLGTGMVWGVILDASDGIGTATAIASLDADHFYVATSSSTILECRTDGTSVRTLIGPEAGLRSISAMAVNAFGDLFVADYQSGSWNTARLSRFSADGRLQSRVPVPGSLYWTGLVTAMAPGPDGGGLLVLDAPDWIQSFDRSGEVISTVLDEGDGLSSPEAVAWEPATGGWLVLHNSGVDRFSPTGVFLGRVLAGYQARYSMVARANGWFLLANASNAKEYTSAGAFVADFATGTSIREMTIQKPPVSNAGAVRFSPTPAGCAQQVEIGLIDTGLDVSPTAADQVNVLVVSPSDPTPKLVLLTEIGPSSGRFRGVVSFSPAPAPTGFLQVTPGDTVTVTYQDLDGGSGAPVTVTDQVQVGLDCTPPVLSNIAVTRVDFERVRVTWTSDEPSTSRLEIGPSAGQLTAWDDDDFVTAHSIEVNGLAACSTWLFRVSGKDALGNLAIADNGGQLYSVSTVAQYRDFDEGFEAGGGGWTHGGKLDAWGVGPVTTGPGGAHSGSGAAGTASAGGGYCPTDCDGATDMWLASPEVHLSSTHPAVLTFWHWYDLYYGASYALDAAWLEMSIDGGATWMLLENDDTTRTTVPEMNGNPWPGRKAWVGSSGAWGKVRVDLARWAGHSVRIRFRLSLYGTDSARTKPGWFVDDVRIDSGLDCGPSLRIRDWEVDDGARGDGDGRLEPGECAVIRLSVGNLGSEAASGIVAAASGGAGVEVLAAESSLASLAPGETSSLGAVQVTVCVAASGSCGSILELDVDFDFEDPGGSPHSSSSGLSWRGGDEVDSVRVVVWDAPSSQVTVPYCTRSGGGNGNQISSALAAGGDVPTELATFYDELELHRLEAYDVLVLAGDNPPVESLADVDAWFRPGKTIVAAGPAFCTAAYLGLFWPEAAGSDGYPTRWMQLNYTSERILASDPITAGYSTGEVVATSTYSSSYTTSASLALLPADATAVSAPTTDATQASVAYRDVPGRGRIVLFGSGVGVNSPAWDLLRSAILAGQQRRCESPGELDLTLELDACSGNSTVVVRDPDGNLSPTATDTLAVSLDSNAEATAESLTLTETGVDSGVFAGSLPTATVGGTGVLVVTPADTVVATYRDLDGPGAPRDVVRSTRVPGECTRPVLSGRVRTVQAPDVVRVDWTTNETADGKVEVGLSPAAVTSRGHQSHRTSHSVVLDGLVPCATHYDRMISTDIGGNAGVLPAGGTWYSWATDDHLVVYAEGFEADAGGFTHGGNGDEWQWGTPTVGGPPGAFEGGRVFGMDLDGTYATQRESWLEGPSVSLPRGDLFLTFAHWYDLHTDSVSSYYYDLGDAAMVEVMGPHGVWEPVAPVGGYPFQPVPNVSTFATTLGWWNGTTDGWTRAVFDLSRWQGTTVRFRFHVQSSVDSYSAPQRWGWYVDDIRIVGRSSCGGPWPVPTGLEIEDVAAGDGDGFVEPGERVDLSVPFRNVGRVAATQLSGQLQSLSTGVTIERFTATYPPPAPAEVVEPIDPFRLAVDSSVRCGSRARLAVRGQFLPAGSLGSVADSQLDLRIGRPRGTPIVVGISATTGSIPYGVPSPGYASEFQFRGLLSADPLGRFAPVTLTSLSAEALAPIDVLLLPNRAVEVDWLDDVEAWFGPGKAIVAVGDNGAAYGAYSGFLWPASQQTNGLNTDWKGYTSASKPFSIVLDRATPAYDAGSAFWGYTHVQSVYPSRLPSDAVVVASAATATPSAVIVERDVPGRGRFTFLGGLDVPQGTAVGLVRDLVASLAGWECNAPSLVRFGQETYGCSGAADVEVDDPLRNLDPQSAESLVVTVTSTSEPAGEALTLVETAPSSGRFRGTIPFGPSVGGGTLTVQGGATLRVAYTTPDAGGTGPLTFSDTAKIQLDCTPPSIVGLAIAPDSREARIRWSTPELTDHRLWWGLACDALWRDKSQSSFTTAHEVILTDLIPDRDYLLRIRARDLSGNEAFAGEGGACLTFRTTAEAPGIFVSGGGNYAAHVDRLGLDGSFVERILPDVTRYQLAEDARGRLLAVTSAGIHRSDRRGFVSELLIPKQQYSTFSDVTACPSGKIWTVENPKTVRRWSEDGQLEATFVPEGNGQLRRIACSADGKIAVGWYSPATVWVFDENFTAFVSIADESHGLEQVEDLLFDPMNGSWLIADSYGDKVWRAGVGAGVSTVIPSVANPTALAWHPDGRILVACYSVVRSYEIASGTLATFADWSTGLDGAYGIVVSSVVPTVISARQLSATFDDACPLGGAGHQDGILAEGEVSTLVVDVENDGNVGLSGVSVQATSLSPSLAIVDGASDLPLLAPGQSATSVAPHLAFRVASATCGTAQIAVAIGSAEGGPWSSIVEVPIGQVTSVPSVVLSEAFASGIPASWTIVNGGTTTVTWTTSNPCGRAPGSPIAAPFVMVDSACSNLANFNDQLVSPVLDLSTAATVTLELDHWFNYKAGGNSEKASIEVKSSRTGGAWSTLRLMSAASTPNPEHFVQDLTATCAGATGVQVRFSYVDAKADGWWIVDNVVVRKTQSVCGGARCLATQIPPPPVADGAGGAALRVSKGSGDELRLVWPVAPCGAAGYELLSAPLGGAFVPNGGACSLPVDGGPWAWTSGGNQDVMFLVVPTDGVSREGIWGRDGSGSPIGGTAPSGRCGMTQRDNSGACP